MSDMCPVHAYVFLLFYNPMVMFYVYTNTKSTTAPPSGWECRSGIALSTVERPVRSLSTVRGLKISQITSMSLVPPGRGEEGLM